MRLKTAVYVASAIVVPLTLLQFYSIGSPRPDKDGLLTLLFFTMFPGSIIGMVVDQQYGGTFAVDSAVPFIAGAVNIAVYSLLILGAVRLLRRVSSKPPGNMDGKGSGHIQGN